MLGFLMLLACIPGAVMWYYIVRGMGGAAKKVITEHPEVAATAIKIAAGMLRK